MCVVMLSKLDILSSMEAEQILFHSHLETLPCGMSLLLYVYYTYLNHNLLMFV